MVAKSLDYSALDIAKWFINAADREAGDAITHLKIQKLVYYGQGWSMALLRHPLFDENLLAWTHGPVARTVWDKYKDSGFDSIGWEKITKRITGNASLLLEAVNDKYNVFSAKQLERMTHSEPPWMEARGGIPLEAKSDRPISKDTMEKYFRGLFLRGKEAKE
jgi:uncharacterized phage-associated protein